MRYDPAARARHLRETEAADRIVAALLRRERLREPAETGDRYGWHRWPPRHEHALCCRSQGVATGGRSR